MKRENAWYKITVIWKFDELPYNRKAVLMRDGIWLQGNAHVGLTYRIIHSHVKDEIKMSFGDWLKYHLV